MGAFVRTLCILLGAIIMANASPARCEPVAFEEALRRVIERSYGLEAARLIAESARAAALQANALPNPRVEARVEDLGDEEIELGLGQTIELGGKRAARADAARAGALSASLAYDARAIGLEAETLRRFAALLAARDRVDLAGTAIGHAETALAMIERRVRAGAARESDLIQARIALEELRAERATLRREVEKASIALTALWGEPSADPLEPAGRLAESLALPPLDTLRALARSHPVSRRFGAEGARIAAELAGERAARYPDIDVGAGVIRYGGSGDAALALSASIPLPVWNRNAAAVREREHLLAAAGSEEREALGRAEAELLTAWAGFDGACGALGALDAEIVPRAEAAYERIRAYYESGAVSFLELNESRRDLARIKLRRIDLLAERASAAADILAITGHRADVFTDD